MTVVLVTGGAGYIGSHTCKALAASGFTPVTYDNLVTGYRHAVRWGPFEYGDICDRARLTEVIATHRPAAVIHFAGCAYVAESVANPAKYYRNNVMGSLSLLQALRDHHVQHIVFSSSCAIYGNPASVPIAETLPPDPINPYGMSKLMVEHMLQDFGNAYGLRWIALRYFNAAGDDPDCEAGEDHEPETRIVPLLLDAASGRIPHFTIYGNDYATPDGTCIRDYVHVTDLAAAHVLALKKQLDGLAPAAFNLGTGQGHSVFELIAATQNVTKLHIPIIYGPRRNGDPAILTSDPGKAGDCLGWVPENSSLENIIKTAWRWHQHKLGLVQDS